MATFTGQTTGTTVLANATIDRYMVARLLKIADKETILYRLGRRTPVPKGESLTVSFTRFERLALPTSPLTQGTTPSATPMSTSRVSCVMEQWGAFVTITDVAEMTVRYEPFQRALDLLGLQSAETADREVLRQLLGGTQVFFPGAVTARSGLAATDFPTTRLLRKVRATLKNAGAPFYDGKRFAGVCDPFNAMDIMADATFVQAATYQDKGVLTDGELGVWMGVRWNECNVLPVIVLLASTNATLAAASAGSGETALTDATYRILMTANDASGFEVGFYAVQTQATTSQVVTIGTPALPTGYSSFNIYATSGADDTTQALQIERAAASTTYRLNGNAGGSNGVAFSSSGRRGFVAPASGVNVHQLFVFGSEYYAVTELDAIKTLRTPAGAQKGDELDQQRSVGWKTLFKACITNHSFGTRIECESDYD